MHSEIKAVVRIHIFVTKNIPEHFPPGQLPPIKFPPGQLPLGLFPPRQLPLTNSA